MTPPRVPTSSLVSGSTSLIAVAAAVGASGFLAGWMLGVPDLMQGLFAPVMFQYLGLFLAVPLPILFLVGRLQVCDDRGRFVPGRPGWTEAWRRFRSGYANPVALGRAALTGLALTLVIKTYSGWKRTLPRVHPFSWDERLAGFDRLLHLGVDPWRILQPWLGTPARTQFLDTVYYTWLPVTFTAMALLAWSNHRATQTRVLLGVVFVWVGLGAVAATLLSSAGPCYYRHLVSGPDPFLPLRAYLQETSQLVPLFAPRLQDALWQLYITGAGQLYSGISAMPSVHVAMPALFALAGWEWRRWLGALLGVYTLVILVATVHLGWHYAVDGYFSIIAVGAYWWAASWLERRIRLRRNPAPPAS